MCILRFTWITIPSFTPAKLIPTAHGHYYSNPQGVQYPSITTMFSKLESFSQSQGYNRWIENISKQNNTGIIESEAIASYISKMAMNHGSNVHYIIENYLNNKNNSISLPLLVQAHFENLKPLLHNISCTEIPLYSDIMKLAGTADCIGEYNGVPSIIDFKTSNKKKDESYITNYFLQATAYCIMWEELTKQTIQQIVILVSSNDGTLQEFVRKPSEYNSLLYKKLEKFEEIRV